MSFIGIDIRKLEIEMDGWDGLELFNFNVRGIYYSKTSCNQLMTCNVPLGNAKHTCRNETCP
jgi:hypothetical protein